jgi:uncharacterized protein YdeI (YjbR/CyaY-like superfamily)
MTSFRCGSTGSKAEAAAVTAVRTRERPDKLRLVLRAFNQRRGKRLRPPPALRILRWRPDRILKEESMGTRDRRIDAYIEKSAPFARPILARLRDVVHAACPEVVETIKWSMPAFDYKGPLCGMAAFKEHCTFGFWKSSLIVENPSDDAMGQLGRITSLRDLPPRKTLTAWVKKAKKLNDEGVQAPREARPKKPAVKVPPDLKKALAGSARARAAFERFPPSHRREYVEWIEEAKRAETRARRIATAVEWMAEGKARNWKYE